jgi:hypothetical protein
MQLDIFEHSRDVMLRNDVVHALEQRDATLAQSSWQALFAECPNDPSLPSLLVLIEAMEASGQAAFRDYDELHRARQMADSHIQQAALRTFGEKNAAAWLRPLWRDLAQRAAPLAFRSDHGEDHTAALWLRAGDWKAAVDAVDAIESWRRIPAPLAWMAQAHQRLYGLQPAWALLAELAWLSPRRFDELVREAGDPVLEQLVRSFEANFEGAGDVDDLAWFPAWVLTDRPALAVHLAPAQMSRHSPPEQAMRVLIELLGLERQGRHYDIIPRRKTLRDLHPSLYEAYMKTR